MPRPVVVIARFTARPDNVATLRSLLQGMLAPTREEPGCDRYDLYQVSQGDEFVLVERYRDELALQHHRTTDHYLNYRAHLDVLLASPISVTVLAPIDER
ncbi:putative quinol monooxygenase [Mycobacterium stomatepiae]|nr:putative quinol monooxygenase [Mycobacterium stomatepiae]MCV7164516.1 antibiotic biosynthesis monooxygenase [Mycobacterium stomatepiae]